MVRVVEPKAVRAPVLALDLGRKRVGVAVSDALSISINPLAALPRTNWKQLLLDVTKLVQSLDAQTVVIGLPLTMNGSYGDAAVEARKAAEKFAQSLKAPVYLQDERLSSVEAEENLRAQGHNHDERRKRLDSESAVVILRDFLSAKQKRILVTNP